MMIEANPIIHPQDSAVIAVLAKQIAVKKVKKRLRAQGIKPRAIRLAADEYLAQHRDELFERVAEMVRGSPALRALYDREQRERERQAERKSRHLQKTEV